MNIDFAKETPPATVSATVRKSGAERSASATAPPPAAAGKKAAPDPGEVDAAIEAANHSMRSVATNLKFEKDTTSGKMVVRVIDSETQQVLRQMPSEEMLAMSKALDRLQGLMVHLKV